MGKKSKETKAASPASLPPKSRCLSCKVFLKNAGRGRTCPGCDKLYCDPCSAFGLKSFLICSNKDCSGLPRCADCAFGETIEACRKENIARKKRGEPILLEREGIPDYPMSFCGNCNEIVCFECSTFSTPGFNGHYLCMEKGCSKVRCWGCCVESGDPKHFIMHCWGCQWSKCSECDPDKTWDGDSGHYYCGKCSSDPEIVQGKELVSATEINSFLAKNGDKKISEL
mmetsp:Transcript_30396/g.55116  ORF Transcript_30396/g.55116 Transcript_30396/m.55116 type:complete len:227 (+) Transcript_30396:209-889(+)